MLLCPALHPGIMWHIYLVLWQKKNNEKHLYIFFGIVKPGIFRLLYYRAATPLSACCVWFHPGLRGRLPCPAPWPPRGGWVCVEGGDRLDHRAPRHHRAITTTRLLETSLSLLTFQHSFRPIILAQPLVWEHRLTLFSPSNDWSDWLLYSGHALSRYFYVYPVHLLISPIYTDF